MKENAHISYKSTVYACYLGNFVQSIVINLTPILFMPLAKMYNLHIEFLGILVVLNFVTQVVVDIVFSGLVDKYGYRRFAVFAPILAFIGFVVFASSPIIFKDNPEYGFILGTFIFSGAGGLLELLLSPMVNSIPGDEKAAAMSVLHSFYAWGQLVVIIITTVAIFIFDNKFWQFIVLFWSIIPIISSILFLKVPLAPAIPEESRQPMKKVIIKPMFILCFCLIAFGGAAEQIAAQWTSTFFEVGLDFPKIIGDTLGVCTFVFAFGLSRFLYGKYGAKINVLKMMKYGTLLALIAYLLFALSPFKYLSLIAGPLCGVGVSLLWPGTISIAAEKFPLAGSWMFAILAAAGDIGCSFGPWLVGKISSVMSEKTLDISNYFNLTQSQFSLRAGMLIGILFPIGAFIAIRFIEVNKNKAL